MQDTSELPKVPPPSLAARVEAALMTLAQQGDPGLRTKLSLMYPSTEIDKASLLKFATIVLARTIVASLQALPHSDSETISKGLIQYLQARYECPLPHTKTHQLD